MHFDKIIITVILLYVKIIVKSSNLSIPIKLHKCTLYISFGHYFHLHFMIFISIYTIICFTHVLYWFIVDGCMFADTHFSSSSSADTC